MLGPLRFSRYVLLVALLVLPLLSLGPAVGGETHDSEPQPGPEVCVESFQGETTATLTSAQPGPASPLRSTIYCSYEVTAQDHTLDLYLKVVWVSPGASSPPWFWSCIDAIRVDLDAKGSQSTMGPHVGDAERLAGVEMIDPPQTGPSFPGTDLQALSEQLIAGVREHALPCWDVGCPEVMDTSFGPQPWLPEDVDPQQYGRLGSSPHPDDLAGEPVWEADCTYRSHPDAEELPDTRQVNFRIKYVPPAADTPTEAFTRCGAEAEEGVVYHPDRELSVSFPIDRGEDDTWRAHNRAHAEEIATDFAVLAASCLTRADGDAEASNTTGADQGTTTSQDGDTYTEGEIGSFLDEALGALERLPPPDPPLFKSQLLADLDACDLDIHGDPEFADVREGWGFNQGPKIRLIVALEEMTIDVRGCSTINDEALAIHRIELEPGAHVGIQMGERPDGQTVSRHAFLEGRFRVTTTEAHRAATERLGLESMVHEVFTDSTKATLQGTDVTFTLTEDGHTRIDTHEGEVVVEDRDGQGSVTVPAGFTTEVLPGQAPSEPTATGQQADQASTGGGLGWLGWLLALGVVGAVGFWVYQRRDGGRAP